ncbi:MAG: pyridoxal phosphate-dependent aminotransferase [Bacteroidales bacterium]|nr:pyridoxal phosphate-dependent aminotransferase [Bacteroidales bacterium]
MLTVSNQALNLPVSAIRRLIPYADAATARGIKVYHLNMGQPDVDSSPQALAAVKENQMHVLGYTNSAGDMSLREGMVKYYAQLGIDLTIDCIIATHGGSEALQIAIAATCDPEDELIVFEPFYTNYNTFAVQNNVTLRPITTCIEDGFKLPEMSEIEKHITKKTKGILFCNPNNPTGCLYSKEDIEKIGQIAKKHELFIYSDEVYREFCYTDAPHFSALQLEGLEENVILLDSVSKRYSLCGARIGFVVSRNLEVMKYVLRYAQARLCVSTYGQIASVGALDTPKSYFNKVRKEYIHRRDILLEEVSKMEGVLCPVPNGAFYAAAELPVDDAERFAIWLLNDFNIDGKTVQVTPMAGFYATKGMGKRQVRLAYVLKEPDLREACRCLKAGLEAYPHHI